AGERRDGHRGRGGEHDGGVASAPERQHEAGRHTGGNGQRVARDGNVKLADRERHLGVHVPEGSNRLARPGEPILPWSPLRGGDSAIFLGGTSAVLTVSGGVTTLVARTGDPLPAPLDGTFNRLASRLAINDDGVVAFTASLNSRRATDGVFLLERDGLVPVFD